MPRKRRTFTDSELQNDASWEKDSKLVQPSKKRRTIVSVAFPRDDFLKVANTAQAMHKTTSEFIREAALGIAVGQASHASMWSGFDFDGDAMKVVTLNQQLPTGQSPTKASVETRIEELQLA